ncbi:MAG: cytochrome P450 [Acidimicrobiales bacterium]|nr:cytochrome P450 [Acidimicrobiales bacterium]
MVRGIDFSPIDANVMADPYPYYEALRRGPSVTYLPDDDLWVVPGFADVWQIARTPESFSSKALRALGIGAISARTGTRPDIRELDARAPQSLIASDPPDHTHLRRLVSRPFTPRAIGTLTGEIRSIAEHVVGDLIAAGERGEADLVHQVAFPLPVLVIAAALGIPAEMRDDFKRWSNALVGRLDGQPLSQEATADLGEMITYFGQVVAERTANPGDDLISWIIDGSAASGEPLAPRDLVSFCTLLLIAGNETTTNLLGNAYNAFFQHPDQFESIRAGADLGPVVEEVLRYDSSIQGILRLANEDVTIGDVTVPRDAVVMILFGSANRDERRWPDGHRFDISREPLDHLGFGSGIHLCLGAHLARLETVTAIDVLRTRLAHIEPRSEPTRFASSILRGFTSMPVQVTPA